MIKYSLICKKCDLTFESWFASSNEFEKLKKRKLLDCHNCGSLDVKKNLMARCLRTMMSLKITKRLKEQNV